MTDEEESLFWHALNYRTAGIGQEMDMWIELEAYVNRRILAEREACAKVCEGLVPQDSANWIVAKGFAEGIRHRSN